MCSSDLADALPADAAKHARGRGEGGGHERDEQEEQLPGRPWRIAHALEQRYGFPYAMRTTDSGFLMRFFQVGDHGVEVTSGFSKVEVEIGSFEALLESSIGRV